MESIGNLKGVGPLLAPLALRRLDDAEEDVRVDGALVSLVQDHQAVLLQQWIQQGLVPQSTRIQPIQTERVPACSRKTCWGPTSRSSIPSVRYLILVLKVVTSSKRTV